MMSARENVVLKHRKQTLYTDSLNYDRLYSNAYFFEGGRLIDGKDKLIADWGEYNTQTREAKFYYSVHMISENRDVRTDTLLYNTRARVAHVLGPSTVTSGMSVVNTEDGFFNTETDMAELYGRPTIIDGPKEITGDTLFHDNQSGLSEGMGNVVYIDKENKNELHCGYMQYNNLTGYGYATGRAMVMDYSQPDTLYLHADSLKIYTYNINTDSVRREVHCFDHVRTYRTDVQAVCDSLVFNSADSCMTMYRDPIVWNGGRQLLGEEIKVYMNDSTIRLAHVIGQALSVEKVDEKEHYNQISSTDMKSHFVGGVLRKAEAIGNVRTIFYPIDDKDSTIIAMNYLETERMVMNLSEQRQLESIWAPKSKGTMYPLTQIPPQRRKLKQFAWFEHIRPTDKNDIFEWRGKSEDSKLKIEERHRAPLQTLEPELSENSENSENSEISENSENSDHSE
jgi:lipopolysaccharide export system protein LptA